MTRIAPRRQRKDEHQNQNDQQDCSGRHGRDSDASRWWLGCRRSYRRLDCRGHVAATIALAVGPPVAALAPFVLPAALAPIPVLTIATIVVRHCLTLLLEPLRGPLAGFQVAEFRALNRRSMSRVWVTQRQADHARIAEKCGCAALMVKAPSPPCRSAASREVSQPDHRELYKPAAELQPPQIPHRKSPA